MKNSIYLSFIYFLVLSSCEKVIDVDIPPIRSQLAINSLIYPDSLFDVKVFKTLATLDRKDASVVPNASVVIYEDGVELEQLNFYTDLGGYKSTTARAAVGKSYVIKVNSPGYDEASAETTIPNAVSLLKIQAKDSAGRDENGNFYSTISFTLNDPKGVNNYYAVDLFETTYYLRHNMDQTVDTVSYRHPLRLIAEPTFEEGYPRAILFNDQLFDGKEHTMVLKFITYYYSFGETDKKDYEVVLRTVHKDYYEYFRRLDDHLNNQGFNIFAGEPVMMPNNVSGGFGIFTGLSEHKIELKK